MTVFWVDAILSMMKKLNTIVTGVYLGKTVKAPTTWEGKNIPAKNIWNVGVNSEGGQEILNISCPVDTPPPPDYTAIDAKVVVSAYNNALYAKLVSWEKKK